MIRLMTVTEHVAIKNTIIHNMFIRTFAAKLWTPLTFARLKPPFPNSPRGPASVETQVQRHLYIPPGRRYARFQQPKRNIFARWASRPTFYYEVGALGGVTAVYYIYNLEEVPVRLLSSNRTVHV